MRMAEWFKVPVLKTEVSFTGVWVRIPFRPHEIVHITAGISMGALTSKPYAFRARPWELQSIDTFDFLDASCAPIRVDIRGSEILRILPRPVNFVNDLFINDRTRFFMDGLKRQRLGTPLSKINGKWLSLSWRNAFSTFKDEIYFNHSLIHGIAGRNVAFPVLQDFKKFINTFGSENFFSESVQLETDKFAIPSLAAFVEGPFDDHAVIILNANLRVEFPLLNARLRRLARPTSIFSFGFANASFVQNLGSIQLFFNMLTGKAPLLKVFTQYKTFTFVLGGAFLSDKQFSSSLMQKFFNSLTRDNCRIFLYSLPQTVSAGPALFLNYKAKMPRRKAVYRIAYLLNADAYQPDLNRFTYIVYHGSHGDKAASFANLILPATTLFESKDMYSYMLDGSLVNYAFIHDAPLEAKQFNFVFYSLIRLFNLKVTFNKLLFKRIFTNPTFNTSFRNLFYKPTRFTSLVHNFHLTDAVTRASSVLGLASLRFQEKREVRGNFADF